jgi:hypothetical protein
LFLFESIVLNAEDSIFVDGVREKPKRNNNT